MTKRSVTKKPKLTKWFDGSVKPVRDGVYQRFFPLHGDGDEIKYSKFKDGLWYAWGLTKAVAAREQRVGMQCLRWRGLAQNPEVQP